MFSYFIWDFDGTLFDTYPVMAKSLESALREYGYSDPYNELIARLKVSSVATMAHYCEKYALGDDFRETYRKYSTMNEGEIKVFDGAIEVCKRIVDTGGKNFIYTHRGLSTEKYMAAAGLDRYFTEYITSDNGFKRKPDPEGVIYLIEKYNLPKELTVMVGDRDVDIGAAKNAGITGCFLRGTHMECKEADITIDRLSQVTELIK